MKLFINGEWIEPYGNEYLNKYSPVDGHLIGKFPSATGEDVNSAIEAAESAFDGWNGIGSVKRSKILYKVKFLIEQNRSELENLLMIENGKVMKEAIQEVDGVLDQIQYYAEFARKINGEIVEGDTSYRKIFQYKVPYGVVVAITPWNFPAAMVARKVAPALLTGNTIVLKPSSDTPFVAEYIVKKFIEAGLPKGVLNLVTGNGGVIGDVLVSHRKVSLVTMTGSTSTGSRIMKKISENMAKPILELGGKAPFIVWKDADIVKAVKSLIWAKFWNSGQSCIAAERLYLHSDIYDLFMNKLVHAITKMRVGDPRTADMGPLISKEALETSEKFVKESVEDGMKILIGGEKPPLNEPFKNGFFFSPTIIEGGRQDSKIFQEEIFGPLIGTMRISSKDELYDLANDSRYGLASYLFTSDHNLIQEASEKIRFGEIYVNMPGPESSQGYHTGFRLSGQAGEGSIYGVEEYLKLKNVYVDYYAGILTIPTINDSLFD